MAYAKRRRIDRVILAVGALVVAAIAAAAAAIGDTERIDRYWTSAEVFPNGQAQIVEVIDYDFGPRNRRGIFRDVRGLNHRLPVMVESPTAPDQTDVTRTSSGARIRIGNPDQTIRGRHRYRIEYPITVSEDDQLSWNAVGSEWPVAIRNIEIHIVTAQSLSDLRCSKGQSGTWDGCTATQPEPGHIVVNIDKVGASEGVTVSATITGPLDAAPPLPDGPSESVSDPGAGILATAIAAAVFAVIGAAAASRAVRHRGRELVWAGGSADAAFGPQFNEQFPVRRVDHDELSSMANIEFAPPKDITAWQGGILHSERATRDHKVAWLLERAIRGQIEIESSDDVTLHLRGMPAPEDRSFDREALKKLFGGRGSIKLATYDEQFAGGWSSLGDRLDTWYANSDYWDPSGERQRSLAMQAGVLGLLAGLLVMVGSAVIANRIGLPWLVGVALGAAATGAGLALLVRRWELRIRTPEGSGLWILIESFRRFIHQSDAQHVDAAARQGLLLDYTAWAVALDEVDAWSKAIEESNLRAPISQQALTMTRTAPLLAAATATAVRAPSSSGGGGGGGFSGSVGGGGGGGGGGSW